MQALRVLLMMVSLLPLRGARDYAFRWQLAEAIVEAAPGDEQAQDTLALIARYESGFARDVARCERRGDRGKSRGVFQLQPIERGDERAACGDLPAQARLAKTYIERSALACPGNVGADKLAMFTSGTCAKGIPQAIRRWAQPRYEFPPM